MQSKLYQPFNKMQFDDAHCFLSGEKIDTKEKHSIFADWLSEIYHLKDMPFKMLDESMKTYADIKVPCSAETAIHLSTLEDKIQNAFEGGYNDVIKLEEDQIFLWVSKTVYGVIFNEIQSAIKQQNSFAEGFNMSQGLIHKFSLLQTMLQKVNQPIVFEEFKPYSLFITKVNNVENEFAYRDEINTLTFSLRMKDFGILINLQDNGANKLYHEEVWGKINGKTLHPIQFEELCAKVFYSAYLFNRLPEYHIITTEDTIYIEAMPLRGMNNKPIFDEWQFKTYGQVVENFWKRWGFLLLEIIKKPEKPMSFLFDENGDFVNAEKIELPL
ncbi:hypothetical protein A5893_12410 [Pedobacter psychrophilus]|uniref:Uncharacterized protein n=1 Tax=Pedobacter psychrophilus TaxID=1826909 RepID=A0A179DCS5_9SPHI|nr:hypothetical protein [Pedobacter psychrophilus]OAQ38841.1 hypothetical protein A5893_12410 [Pedobacter psychrophilus]